MLDLGNVRRNLQVIPLARASTKMTQFKLGRTIAMLVVLSAALAGCPRRPSTIDAVSQWASTRLDQISRLGDVPREQLNCPQGDIFRVQVQILSSQAIHVQYCPDIYLEPQPDGTTAYILALRNDSRVPIRIGNTVRVEPAVEPGHVFQVRLPDFRLSGGHWAIDYRVDVEGAAYLIADELIPKPSPSAFLSCASELTVGCLISQAAKFAPEEVRVGSIIVPAKAILDVLDKIVLATSVVSRWQQLSAGAQNGTVDITS